MEAIEAALPRDFGDDRQVEFVKHYLIDLNATQADMYRGRRIYTGQILKGVKPADLPVAPSTPNSSLSSTCRRPGHLASTCPTRSNCSLTC